MRKANVFAGYFPQSNGTNKRGREEAKCLTAVGTGGQRTREARPATHCVTSDKSLASPEPQFPYH